MRAMLCAVHTGDAERPPTTETISSAFILLIEGAVAEYIAKWQERPAPGGASWEQQYDPELLKDELRPLVFEEVRQQVRVHWWLSCRATAGG